VDGSSLGVKRGRARGTIGVVGNSRTCHVPWVMGRPSLVPRTPKSLVNGDGSKPCTPFLFTSKSLGFMDVNNTLKMVCIGIDP